jgi:glycosyltransferase involved in cell wall biosynthesis
MRITFWGVYESDYPRNRIFIDGLKKREDCAVNLAHVPLFEKSRDKSGKFLSLISLIRLFFRFIAAYARLTGKFFRFRGKTDLWVCGYIGQPDVIYLFLLKLVFFNRKPLLFNPLVSLFDTVVLDRKQFPEKSPVSFLIRLADKLSFRFADRLIFDTEVHRDFISRVFSIPRDKISVIPVGAEELFFKEEPVYPDVFEASFRVQFVGKFIPLHGIDIILRAAEKLKKENVTFDIIGSGQLEEWFEEEVKRLKLFNVRHTRWIDYEELPQIMEKAHISLGIFNPGSKALRVVPNKVYQALAMGRVIVTAASPATDELKKLGISLNTVPPGDGLALAEMILRIKANYGDYRNAAEESREIALKYFTPEKLGEAFINTARSVVRAD